MKKIWKFLASMVLALAVLFTTVGAPVYAANTCRNISGNANSTVTFTIKTDRRWTTSKYITFRSQKGKANKRVINSNGGDVKINMYGVYKITVTDSRGRSKTYTMKGSSLSIKCLKGNSTYRVTVRPGSNNELRKQKPYGHFEGWSTVATWSISKTSGITLCR